MEVEEGNGKNMELIEKQKGKLPYFEETIDSGRRGLRENKGTTDPRGKGNEWEPGSR
jgi:hypothetical protein